MTNLCDRGSYSDMTITMPANTYYARGLVLGCAEGSNKLIPYGTKEVTQAQGEGSASSVYAENPEYVLVNLDGIKNDTDNAIDITAKVLCVGFCNAYALCFAKETDTIDSAGFLTKLKNNGIIAERIENYVEN